MWRKACMGDTEAIVTLAVVTFAAWWVGVVTTALYLGWAGASVLAVLSATTLVARFWRQSRAWDAWFCWQTNQGMTAIDELLRRPERPR